MAAVDGEADATARREWRLGGLVAFGLLAALVLAAALRVLWTFLSPILVALALVVLTHRLYRRLVARLGGRAPLAALLMLLAITLLLVVPAFVVVLLLLGQAKALVDALQSGEAQAWIAALDLGGRMRFLTRLVPGFDASTIGLEQLVLPLLRQVPGWVARHGQAVAGGVATLFLDLCLVLLASYFFYLEGDALRRELALLSPLPRRYGEEFAARFAAVVDATFRGQLLTSFAQAAATAVGLALAGVPGALLWGALAAVLSLLPMVGAAIVWVPATLYLAVAAALGHRGWGGAIFLAVWGLLVVSTIDNAVRPWAMRGRAQLPAIPLLFAVLGGLEAFGFVGLLIGPLVLSLVSTVLGIYKESIRPQLASARPGPGA